ncbi:MAG TPA: hypothetical protein P5081_08130 [Phycisphaerae bacterium]|nr:hypothetical protein [Phycisphaerae bacterium]HRW52841.1 hypothetical protein [Phycisphaerae bacterium]
MSTHSDNPTDVSSSEPIKRPFTRATGFIFQSVGFILTMSTCCVWPASHWWQSYQPDTDIRAMERPLESARPEQVWAMTSVAGAFLGGMLLLVIGLGLQHDRMRTGRAAMAVTGVAAAYFLVYLGMCVWRFPEPFRIVIAAAMGLIWVVMFTLAGVSADELRRNPPTPSERGWTSIDEDDLRTIASHRRRDRTNP